jgi:hypothetical protein
MPDHTNHGIGAECAIELARSALGAEIPNGTVCPIDWPDERIAIPVARGHWSRRHARASRAAPIQRLTCNHLYVEQRSTENVDSKGWPTGPVSYAVTLCRSYMPKIALGTIPKKGDQFGISFRSELPDETQHGPDSKSRNCDGADRHEIDGSEPNHLSRARIHHSQPFSGVLPRNTL